MKQRFLSRWSMVLSLAVPLMARAADPVARSTPINAAEAIVEPFWDPQTSGLAEWQTADGAAHGLKVSQGWSWVDVEWARQPAVGPALRLSRALDLNCARYDQLMVCANPGKGNLLRLTAETDAGTRRASLTGYLDERKEYFLPLDGARRLRRVTLEIEPAKAGVGAAWIQWVGLQSSPRLADVRAQYSGFDPAWPRHLKPAGTPLQFAPVCGIAIDGDDVQRLRAAYRCLLARQPSTVFEQAAEHARRRAPETMITDAVSYINSRCGRDRDGQRWLLQTGVNAAVAGLVLQDADLLRLGARYALAIAACTYWDDGFTCYYPLSAWEQRPFIQALAAHDVAMLLDLAGELFTDAGRDLLLRRLAEHGLGSLNYSYWKHDYIYDCNQAAWFSPGRLLAYAVLEHHWPRVRPYTDLARDDLLASLERIVLADGSYGEGPMYFQPVGRDAALALYYFSRCRRQPFLETLPPRLRKAADFGELVMTTTDQGDFIPYADSYVREFSPFAKAAMTGAMPDSAWGLILRRTFERTRADPDTWPLGEPFHPGYLTSLSDVVLAWKLARGAPLGSFTPRPFVYLPESGMMASFRRLGPLALKLLVMGSRANAGHHHEDKGSFILELGGEAFVCDPILGGSYGDPATAMGKHAQNHNLLLPVGTVARPAPLNPLAADCKPVGQGDERSFRAVIDLTDGWPGFYRRWVRAWESPTPDRLTIRDEYQLAQGTGVEFVLFTERPVEVQGTTAMLKGKTACLSLAAPPDCRVRVEDVGNGRYRRIVIARPGASGTLQVECVMAAGG